jgi:hypothetical protein
MSALSPLLDEKPVAGSMASGPALGGGKRGKKRARNAEDSLVGGLEGREARALDEDVGQVVIESFRRMCGWFSASVS